MSIQTVLCYAVLFLEMALGSAATGDELLLVQAVWRHGDRSPIGTFPTDEHQEDSWPEGWGQLSTIGMKQHYALGARLRSMYDGFITPYYKAGELYVRSTDISRTLMSAESNLAGFYMNGTVDVDFPSSSAVPNWPSLWSPIPVHTVDIDTDHIGDPTAYCPRANQILGQLAQSDSIQNFTKQTEPLFEFLSNVTGMEVDFDSITYVYDALNVERIHSMSLPSWLNDTIWNQIVYVMERTMDLSFGIDPYTPELILLRGGSLLKAMIDNMQTKIACGLDSSHSKCKLKYHAYSAHDTTVAALLTTFGDEHEVLSGGLPKYAVAVAVELWNTTSGLQVKILFHPTFGIPFHPITNLTQGCPSTSDYCPFPTFLNRSQIFIPNDINVACQPK